MTTITTTDARDLLLRVDVPESEINAGAILYARLYIELFQRLLAKQVVEKLLAVTDGPLKETRERLGL